jgi:hypothetical protein
MKGATRSAEREEERKYIMPPQQQNNGGQTNAFFIKVKLPQYDAANQKPAKQMKLIRGHCHCHDHSFCIEAAKVRFGFASCHCSICRSSHAAPFVMWAGMNADCSTPEIFQVTSIPNSLSSLTAFRSSPTCTHYFCSRCGSHLYIKYDEGERWGGEVHFPTALLDEESLKNLEEVVTNAGRPRYLHVFASDRHGAMGDLQKWTDAPKYGGTTGLEPLGDT